MEENKPQLLLNMILAEDEQPKMVKRVIDTVKDYIDGMVIAVTYKEKQPDENSPLVKLLHKYLAKVIYFKWVYDFAKARQFVLDNTPHGIDKYITWIDADDVLHNGQNLRGLLEEAYTYNLAAIFIPYWYQVDLDDKGNVREIVIEHRRERIIRNDGTFRWIGALHETLIEQRTENIIKIAKTECVVVHLSNDERIDKNIKRNIQILEDQARKEQHKDPRTILYLGKAYFDQGKFIKDLTQKKINFDLATTLLEEYLRGVGVAGTPGYQEGSGWAEERAIAWNYIAQIAILNKRFNVATKALHNAIIEAPQFPEYYIDMALILCEKKDYPKAKHWLNLATSIPAPDTTVIQTPRDLKTRALEVDYQIAISEQDLDRALKDSELLAEILPDVQMIQDRLLTVKSLQAYNRACQSVVYLGKYLEEIKEPEKLPNLIHAIPRDMNQEKFASEMRHLFLPAKVWHDDEVAILCGPGFEQWSPKSIETGLGGSEQAVVYLAQELAKLGWKVTVYANPLQDGGEYDGVVYKEWYDLNVKDTFNALILWRQIGFVDFNPKAKFIMVWMHDVPSNPEFTEERINKVDKIAVLSEYHKSLLRLNKGGEFVPMPEDKVFLTANGMQPLYKDVLENKELKRNLHRMIYTSSYDRGLIYLLRMWPDIKKAVPEAELHIYYGWNLYDTIHRNNPARMQWKQIMVDLMKQEGVTEHGRVGHKQLAEAFMQSAIFSYSSDFQEISCMSAMLAQAYGAVPVVTNYAALVETVRNGLKVDADITTKEGQEEYKKALISLLQDHQKQEELCVSMMKWAQKYFLWEKVASNWDELIKSTMKNLTFDNIPDQPSVLQAKLLEEGEEATNAVSAEHA